MHSFVVALGRTVLLLAAMAAAAVADIVVDLHLEKPGATVTEAADVRVSIAPDRLALVPIKRNNAIAPNTTVYRGDLDVLWTILPLWKWYVQVDSRVVAQQQQEDMEKRARAITETVMEAPPAERAALEERLRAEALAISPEPEWTPTDRTETIGGWKARILEQGRGRWRQEIAVATFADVGLTPDDCGVVWQMTRTVATWWAAPSDSTPPGPSAALRTWSRLDGVPVRLRQFWDGALVTDFTVTGVRREDVPATTYLVPPGFERRESTGVFSR